jgi:hypothetical protein
VKDLLAAKFDGTRCYQNNCGFQQTNGRMILSNMGEISAIVKAWKILFAM